MIDSPGYAAHLPGYVAELVLRRFANRRVVLVAQGLHREFPTADESGAFGAIRRALYAAGFYAGVNRLREPGVFNSADRFAGEGGKALPSSRSVNPTL